MDKNKFKDLAFDENGLPEVPVETAMFMVLGGGVDTMADEEQALKQKSAKDKKAENLDTWGAALGVVDALGSVVSVIPGVGTAIGAGMKAVSSVGQSIVESSYETGGFLEGVDYSNSDGFIVVKGPKHGEMTDQGIVPGVNYTKDSSSQPTFVEGGEVIWEDFVFTNSRPIPDDIAKKLKVKKGLTFAEAAQKLNAEYETRPGNPRIKEGRDEMLGRLREYHLQYVPESRPENMALAGVNNVVQGGNFGKYGGEVKYLAAGGNPTDPPYDDLDGDGVMDALQKQPTLPMSGYEAGNNIMVDPLNNVLDEAEVTGELGEPGAFLKKDKSGAPYAQPIEPSEPAPEIPKKQIPDGAFIPDDISEFVPSDVYKTGEPAPTADADADGGGENPPGNDNKSKYYDQLRYAPIIASGADAIGSLFSKPDRLKAGDYTIDNKDTAEEMNIEPILAQIDRGQRTSTRAALENISNPALLASLITSQGSQTSRARGEAVMKKQNFDIAERNLFAQNEARTDQYNSQIKLGVRDRNDANRAAWLSNIQDSAAAFAQNLGNLGREEKLSDMVTDVFGYDAKTGKFTGSPMLKAGEFSTALMNIFQQYYGTPNDKD